QCPDQIRCRVGQAFDERPPDSVAVASDEHHARVFAQTGQPFVRVSGDDEETALVESWGLRPASETLRTDVAFTAAGDPEPMIDAFPLLRTRLPDDRRSMEL